jgi:hypothetical protein
MLEQRLATKVETLRFHKLDVAKCFRVDDECETSRENSIQCLNRDVLASMSGTTFLHESSNAGFTMK